jgi:hypothetical protein
MYLTFFLPISPYLSTINRDFSMFITGVVGKKKGKKLFPEDVS